MPFEFRYEGKSLDIDDVPLSVYADIESATGVAWFDLSVAPARYAAAGEQLAKACARELAVDLPPLTPKLLVEVFKLAEKTNLPAEFTDGMPDPKAPDSDPETT